MYKPTDKMIDLIAHDYKVLLVMSRFGIPLGFGDRSIEEVCKENNIDTTTFLIIVEIVAGIKKQHANHLEDVSAEELVTYLKNSHDYFLNFRLPSIREKLYTIVSKENTDLTKAIIFYFDEYIAEVRGHMGYEDKNVFPYIKSLIDGKPDPKYNISIFERQHNSIEDRITEFKNIIIKYYPAKSTNEINSALFDIFSCEEDLISHIRIEDELLVPVVKQIENSRKK